MQFSSVPISLSQFNHMLEKSTSLLNLRQSFSFAEKDFKKHGFTLSSFINATKFLIESYQDLNCKKFRFCIKKIKQIFPISTENDLITIHAFVSKINTFFYYRITKFVPEAKVILRQPTHLQKLCAEKQLLQASEIFLFSDQERIEEAFLIESAITDAQKAYICQLILNFLVVESDLIKLTSQFFDDFVKYNETNDFSMLGCSRLLRLSAFLEMRLFPIHSDLENTDIFAFWLNLSPYLDLFKDFDTGDLYASLKPIHVDDVNFNIKEHFNHLKAITTNNDVKFFIDAWLKAIELFSCGKKISKSIKTLNKFIANVTKSALSSETYSDQLEYLATPAAYWLFSVIRKIFVETIQYSQREIPKEDLFKIKQGLQFFSDNKKSQRTLFSASLERLNLLIASNPRQKKDFMLFKKDLTEASTFRLGPLRQYPCDDEILESPNTRFSTCQKILKEKKSTPKSKRARAPSKAMTPLIASTVKAGDVCLSPTLNALNKKPCEHKQIAPVIIAKETFHAQAKCEPISMRKPPDCPLSKDLASPFPYKLDCRVSRWSEHPFKTALPSNIFPEYAEKPLNYQILMHLFHNLDLVDPFISKGIRGQWKNSNREKNDIRFVIPAEITFEEKKQRGLITYAIDVQTQICYHRFFTNKIDKDILSLSIKKIFDENDFPELQKAVILSKSKAKQYTIKSSQAQISEDPLTGNVLIEDFERKVKIKLFNTN